MKLSYVNLERLKSPYRSSKGIKKDFKRIERIKNELNKLDEDVFVCIISKYNIPDNYSKKEDMIEYLSEKHYSLLENELSKINRYYFEPKNILLEKELNNLDNLTLEILFSKYRFPRNTNKIESILVRFSYEDITNAILSSKEEALEKEKEIKLLKNELESLDDESLDIIFKKFSNFTYFNKRKKIKLLCSEEIDSVKKEIENLKFFIQQKNELRYYLNSLNDDELNKLFDKFFIFGEHLNRQNKVNSLLKCDNEKVYEESNNIKIN